MLKYIGYAMTKKGHAGISQRALAAESKAEEGMFARAFERAGNGDIH